MSQGQSLKVAGLYLMKQSFPHGQIYIGFSIFGNRNKLYVVTPNVKNSNVVYHAALQYVPNRQVISIFFFKLLIVRKVILKFNKI